MEEDDRLIFFGHSEAVDSVIVRSFLIIGAFEKTAKGVAGRFDFGLDTFGFFGVVLAMELFD